MPQAGDEATKAQQEGPEAAPQKWTPNSAAKRYPPGLRQLAVPCVPFPVTSHGVAFDPSYGYDLQALKKVGAPAPPPGYERFWRGAYDAALKVAPNPELKRRSRLADHDLYEVHYDGLDGRRLGGWLALPHSAPADSAVVVAHGYEGAYQPNEANLKHDGGPTTALLYPSAPGFGLSADEAIPGEGHQHVVAGIESRDTYSAKSAVAGIWAGANALLAIAPTTKDHLYLQGTSFGGGVGTMALAWDKRFSKAYFEVPTFGNQPLRLTLPTQGSGEALRDYLAAHPKDRDRIERDVLSFYDAGTAARFVTTPTMVAAALRDASVAPPGQFAIYNALPGEKSLFVMRAGHADLTPVEDAARQQARRRFFGFEP